MKRLSWRFLFEFNPMSSKSKSKIKIRQANISDIEQIVDVEKKAWKAEGAADSQKFESRIKTFQKGTLVAELEGKIIGVVVTEIINYNDWQNKNFTWYDVTDNGFLAKTHNPNGDTIYGVDLSVIPDAPPGVGTKLLECIAKMAIKYNMRGGMLGGRMPDYHAFANKYSPEEYIKQKKETKKGLEPLDSEIRFYSRAGLKIIKILPNYFKDPESLDYGLLLFWKNPFYNKWYRKLAAFFFSV